MFVSLNDRVVDFDVCVSLMDDDLREQVHSDFDFIDGTDQDFLDFYCALHFDKYGEDFTI